MLIDKARSRAWLGRAWQKTIATNHMRPQTNDQAMHRRLKELKEASPIRSVPIKGFGAYAGAGFMPRPSPCLLLQSTSVDGGSFFSKT